MAFAPMQALLATPSSECGTHISSHARVHAIDTATETYDLGVRFRGDRREYFEKDELDELGWQGKEGRHGRLGGDAIVRS